MMESCYNCAKYISAKKKNDYIVIPAIDNYLSYKKYNGCNSLRVYLNTDNINRQDSEESQLKYRGCSNWQKYEESQLRNRDCSNWKKHEEFHQLSIFDFIEE